MILDGILKEVDKRVDALADKLKRDAEIGALKVLRDAIDGKIAALESQK